jgi:hypothetical protein
MRHLRAMKERAVAPDSLAPFAAADFAALPHRVPLDAYARLERRGVSFDGCVQRLLTAADGDIHFELVAFPRGPESGDTTYVTAELTPRWGDGSVRWSYERLVASLRPDSGGVTAWDAGPRRARIGGWLLYDFQYDQPPRPDARPANLRLTGWEIHPITRIELWDDSLRRFVDLPR